MCRGLAVLTWTGCLTALTGTQESKSHYVNTSKQIVDILTTASFSRERWSKYIHSCIHFTSFVSAERGQDVETPGRTYDRKRHWPNKGLCAIFQRTFKWSRATVQTMFVEQPSQTIKAGNDTMRALLQSWRSNPL